MECPHCQPPSIDLGCFVDKWRIALVCNYINSCIETVENFKRGLVIRELQIIQNGQHNKLSIELMRLENEKLEKDLMSDPNYVPRSYGKVIVRYIVTIPRPERNLALRAILEAVEIALYGKVLVKWPED